MKDEVTWQKPKTARQVQIMTLHSPYDDQGRNRSCYLGRYVLLSLGVLPDERPGSKANLNKRST